jgi:hypothetical protein
VTRLVPKDRWGRSIFADNAKVAELAQRSPSRLVEVPRLRDSLHHAVNNKQWFTVCCLCSILGELVYAVLDPKNKADKFPGIDSMRTPSTGPRNVTQKRNQFYFPVAALRHTCCHPAMSSPMRELPKDIFPNMAGLHTADAADWALEQLDEALRFDLGER